MTQVFNPKGIVSANNFNLTPSVIESIANFIPGSTYKESVGNNVVANTGVITDDVNVYDDDWRKVYSEFAPYGFDPTQVAVNTNDPNIAKIALAFEACDEQMVLDAAVVDCDAEMVAIVLANSEACPQLNHLMYSCQHNDSATLKHLMEDERINADDIAVALSNCVRENKIKCLEIMLDTERVDYSVVADLVKVAVEENANAAMFHCLIRYVDVKDFNLLTYIRERRTPESALVLSLLRAQFDKIDNEETTELP